MLYLCGQTSVKYFPMSRLQSVWEMLGRIKYLLIIIVMAVIIGILDDNSYYSRWQRRQRMSAYEEQITKLREQYETDSTTSRPILPSWNVWRVNATSCIAMERISLSSTRSLPLRSQKLSYRKELPHQKRRRPALRLPLKTRDQRRTPPQQNNTH